MCVGFCLCVSYVFICLIQHICSKCGIWSNSRQCPVWLCRICNEQQEVRERKDEEQRGFDRITGPNYGITSLFCHQNWRFSHDMNYFLLFRFAQNCILLSIDLENYLPFILRQYTKWAISNDLFHLLNFNKICVLITIKNEQCSYTMLFWWCRSVCGGLCLREPGLFK